MCTPAICVLPIDPPSMLCLEMLELRAGHPRFPGSLGSRLPARLCPWQALAGLMGSGEERRIFLPAFGSCSSCASSRGLLHAHPLAASAGAPLARSAMLPWGTGSSPTAPRHLLGTPKPGPVPRAGQQALGSLLRCPGTSHTVPLPGGLNSSTSEHPSQELGPSPGPLDAIMPLSCAHVGGGVAAAFSS